MSTMSSAKHDVELPVVDIPNPSLHVDDDVVVEWSDIGRESTVQLSKDSDVLSRNALSEQGFEDRFSLDGVECLLQVDERKAQRQLVLSRHFDELRNEPH
ncbi:unnamed protein product [Heligmosomoides polygyrus]|uniref:DUF3006 domain-containing protein n=1 Tax=Heligmosomoides polygyrus TaxID=6339 RepID=A0A183FTD6_HELPZ|nr:unnamed protein product [Heligmosomoides polygyrus]